MDGLKGSVLGDAMVERNALEEERLRNMQRAKILARDSVHKGINWRGFDALSDEAKALYLAVRDKLLVKRGK